MNSPKKRYNSGVQTASQGLEAWPSVKNSANAAMTLLSEAVTASLWNILFLQTYTSVAVFRPPSKWSVGFIFPYTLSATRYADDLF